MSWLNRLFGSEAKPGPPSCLISLNDPDLPSLQDTLAAIDELSHAIHNNPDAVEIYLALGNLYRSKGELERAAHIRNNIIIRPGLDNKFKAKAWFELGIDYRRAGMLDRALSAFNEAQKSGGHIPDLKKQMAQLAEDSGDFERAASYYREMDQHIPQAHALVRLAQKYYDNNEYHKGSKRLDEALHIFPGAPDAWLMKLWQVWQEDPEALPVLFQQAVSTVRKDMQLILIESFFEKIKLDSTQQRGENAGQTDNTDPLPENMHESRRRDQLIAAVSVFPENLLSDYYLARIYLHSQDYIKAKEHLNRCLLSKNDFWPAHVELLYLAFITEKVPPLLHTQLKFFMSRKRKPEKFCCRQCGLLQNYVFFLCPRCRSWYSIAMRNNLDN